MSEEFETTADMIEGLIQRTFRTSSGGPGPAREVRAEAERVAPELDRLWEAGQTPSLSVDLDAKGNIVVSVRSAQ